MVINTTELERGRSIPEDKKTSSSNNFQRPLCAKNIIRINCLCFCLSVFVVDRLQAHWEDSQTKLSDRMKQLHNMLQDSTNWLDAKKGVDPLIKRANERLESWREISYTVDALKKQNAELKVDKPALSTHIFYSLLAWVTDYSRLH